MTKVISSALKKQLMSRTTVLLVITGAVDLTRNPETWQNHELFTWKMKTECTLLLQGQLQKIQDNDVMEKDKISGQKLLRN